MSPGWAGCHVPGGLRAVDRPPGFDSSMAPGVIPCGAAPVVVPCFILLDFILSGADLEPVSLFARGAGCADSVCADAIAAAPNNEATTRADIASLDRMRISRSRS